MFIICYLLYFFAIATDYTGRTRDQVLQKKDIVRSTPLACYSVYLGNYVGVLSSFSGWLVQHSNKWNSDFARRVLQSSLLVKNCIPFKFDLLVATESFSLHLAVPVWARTGRKEHNHTKMLHVVRTHIHRAPAVSLLLHRASFVCRICYVNLLLLRRQPRRKRPLQFCSIRTFQYSWNPWPSYKLHFMPHPSPSNTTNQQTEQSSRIGLEKRCH